MNHWCCDNCHYVSTKSFNQLVAGLFTQSVVSIAVCSGAQERRTISSEICVQSICDDFHRKSAARSLGDKGWSFSVKSVTATSASRFAWTCCL